MTNFETQARKLLEEIANHAFYEGVEIDSNEDYATDDWEPSIEEALGMLLALHQAELERAAEAVLENAITELREYHQKYPDDADYNDLISYLVGIKARYSLSTLRSERQSETERLSHD